MAPNNWKFEICEVYLVYYDKAEVVKPTCLLLYLGERFIMNFHYFFVQKASFTKDVLLEQGNVPEKGFTNKPFLDS